MRPFTWNLVLAIIWVALTGDLSASTFAVGLVLGYLVLALAGPVIGAPQYGNWVWQVVGFLLFYIWEVLLSNIRVARDVVRPRMLTSPSIVAIPVEGLNESQITLLANLITMTPGTLSLDVSADRSTLYVHAIFGADPQGLRDSIERGLTQRVRGVMQ